MSVATWQVGAASRSDDLDNAREHGVTVHEGTRVLEVLFDRASSWREIKDEDAPSAMFRQVVVDASGQNGLLQNKLTCASGIRSSTRARSDLLEGAYRTPAATRARRWSSRPAAERLFLVHTAARTTCLGRRRGPFDYLFRAARIMRRRTKKRSPTSGCEEGLPRQRG